MFKKTLSCNNLEICSGLVLLLVVGGVVSLVYFILLNRLDQSAEVIDDPTCSWKDPVSENTFDYNSVKNVSLFICCFENRDHSHHCPVIGRLDMDRSYFVVNPEQTGWGPSVVPFAWVTPTKKVQGFPVHDLLCDIGGLALNCSWYTSYRQSDMNFISSIHNLIIRAPKNNSAEIRYVYTLKTTGMLDANKGDETVGLMWASMFVNSSYFDTKGVKVDGDETCLQRQPSSNVFYQKSGISEGILVGGINHWKIAPNVFFTIKPSQNFIGYWTKSANPNDDNVGGSVALSTIGNLEMNVTYQFPQEISKC